VNGACDQDPITHLTHRGDSLGVDFIYYHPSTTPCAASSYASSTDSKKPFNTKSSFMPPTFACFTDRTTGQRVFKSAPSTPSSASYADSASSQKTGAAPPQSSAYSAVPTTHDAFTQYKPIKSAVLPAELSDAVSERQGWIAVVEIESSLIARSFQSWPHSKQWSLSDHRPVLTIFQPISASPTASASSTASTASTASAASPFASSPAPSSVSSAIKPAESNTPAASHL
jgi:hypothetical protein